MLEVGTCLKLIAPRMTSSTLCFSRCHWSDFRSVLYMYVRKLNIFFDVVSIIHTLHEGWFHFGTIFIFIFKPLSIEATQHLTLITCSVYSSPRIWPPEIAKSFFFPATNERAPEPDLDRDDRSLIGENTFNLEPYVFRRKRTWLKGDGHINRWLHGEREEKKHTSRSPGVPSTNPRTFV